MQPDFSIVIPARLGSTRLPDKPLQDVAGKPLIVRVWERAMQCAAADVIVAVDDARILSEVERAGGQAVLTRKDHQSGTDRLAEVAKQQGWPDDHIVVNLQGDEPLVPTNVPDELARALKEHPEAGISTAAVAIESPDELFNPNVVKTVLAESGLAHYFSRAPIPWARDAFAGRPPTELPADLPFLRHLGLYAYRAKTLHRLSAAATAPAERAERLEQLRALSLGIPVHVTVLHESPGPGVDTEQDLAVVTRLFEEG